MQSAAFSRRLLRPLSVATMLFACATAAHGSDSYSGGVLTMSSLSVGGATYSQVVVRVSSILTEPAGTAANGSTDSYDPTSGRLVVQSVTVGSANFYNAVASVAALVSIASLSGADTYDGTYLHIPSVEIEGGATYSDVVVKVGSILSPGGGMPHNAVDVYNPASKQLTISAIAVGGQVYTNPVVTVSQVISVGSIGNSSACYDPVYYTTGTVSDVFYQVSNHGTSVEALEEQNVVLPTATFNAVPNTVPIQTTTFENGAMHSVITEYFDITSQFPTLLEIGQSDGVSFDPGIKIFGDLNAGQSLVSSGTVEPAAIAYTANWKFEGFETLSVPAGTFSGACKWTLVENLGSGAAGATSWYNRHGVLLQTVAGTGIELQLMPNSTFNGSPVGP